MRNRFKPSEVARVGFGSGRIAVTKGYGVATVNQHERTTLAVSEEEVSQAKDAERRDKWSVRIGEDTWPRQDP